MTKQYRFDFSKVPFPLFEEAFISPTIATTFKIVRKAFIGNLDECYMDELPAIFAQYSKALKEQTDYINIAINSMLNHLTDNDD